MTFGWTEEQILDMTLDKYDMYMRASHDVDLSYRRQVVMDTQAAIGGAFSKEGVTEYLNEALSGE
jgi:hypothetical protein